jgi:hypothetical protein
LMKAKYYRLHLRKVNHQYSWLTHLERYLPNWNITCFFCTCMPGRFCPSSISMHDQTIVLRLNNQDILQNAWGNNPLSMFYNGIMHIFFGCQTPRCISFK